MVCLRVISTLETAGAGSRTMDEVKPSPIVAAQIRLCGNGHDQKCHDRKTRQNRPAEYFMNPLSKG